MAKVFKQIEILRRESYQTVLKVFSALFASTNFQRSYFILTSHMFQVLLDKRLDKA